MSYKQLFMYINKEINVKKTFLVLYLFIVACHHNSGNYGKSLQPWIGQSEERLLQSWGTPQNVFYVTGNEKIFTYTQFSTHKHDFEAYPNEVYYPAIAVPNFGFPSQPAYTTFYCKTSFTIQDNIVTNYSFNGDGCV